MFSCRDATELMTVAGDDALSGGELARYRIHLFICRDCRTYRRQLGEAVAIAKEAPPERLPSEIEEKLLAAFRTRKETQKG